MSSLGGGTTSRPTTMAMLLRETAEPFDSIEHAEIGPLLDRIGDARVVLLGEASHGSSEFYRMRAQRAKFSLDYRENV